MALRILHFVLYPIKMGILAQIVPSLRFFIAKLAITLQFSVRYFIALSKTENIISLSYILCQPGAVARLEVSSEASLLGCKRPRVRSPCPAILSWRLGHENISTAILPLPLIQEEQLSVTGERMCTKYW